jgi:hypothetical protein
MLASKISTSISATSSRYEATILPERLRGINCYSYILLKCATFNIKCEEVINSLDKKSDREFKMISVLFRNGCVEQRLLSQGQNFLLFKKYCTLYGTTKFITIFITYRQ